LLDERGHRFPVIIGLVDSSGRRVICFERIEPLGLIKKAVVVSPLFGGDLRVAPLASRVSLVASVLWTGSVHNQTVYTSKSSTALQHIVTSLDVFSKMIERGDLDCPEEEKCRGGIAILAGTCEYNEARRMIAIQVFTNAKYDCRRET
jgi:hypothetical protein